MVAGRSGGPQVTLTLRKTWIVSMVTPVLVLFLMASRVPTYSPEECLKLVKIPPGCIELPCDYLVVHTGGMIDFSFGYIEPPGKSWRVLWSAGMVQHLLDPRSQKEIVWFRQEELAGRTVKLGRVRSTPSMFSVASVWHLQASRSAIGFNAAAGNAAWALVKLPSKRLPESC